MLMHAKHALTAGHKGLVLALTVALCAGFLSDHYGAPLLLFALLIGMAFNFLAEDARCKPGLDFASRDLLRFGVALLGFRLSLGDVADLGWSAVAVLVGLVALTVTSGAILAPLLGRSRALGLLTGGAVGICGASAAMALAAVMPRRDGHERDLLFTVVAVTTLSTVAMVLYPLLFSTLGFDDAETGFLIGATIHDVAQVVGAGFSVSDTAVEQATLTKLMRVLLLPVVIISMVLLFRTQGGDRPRVVQPFVLAFIAFMLINSTGVVPAAVSNTLSDLSRWCLVIAIAALGVKTSLAAMLDLGGRHVLLVVAQTLLLLGVAIGVVMTGILA